MTSNLSGIHSALIQMAAELVRGEGVPDWSEQRFYRSTPKAEQRRMLKALRAADESLRSYGIRLKDIADKVAAEMQPVETAGVLPCGDVWGGSEHATCVLPAGHDGDHVSGPKYIWSRDAEKTTPTREKCFPDCHDDCVCDRYPDTPRPELKTECSLCASGMNSFTDPATGKKMHARNGVVSLCSAPNGSEVSK